ncbi:MAG: oligosaccharide flippase family protein [Vicinamibacterales bacterium]
MTAPGAEHWATAPEGQFATVARNLSTRYVAIAAEIITGLVMLPFNLSHLGKDQYGLWVLLGSLTVHFSTLDLGYASGLVKFVAKYRAHRDARALNEIASTLFCVFTGIALVAYAIVMAVAFNLDWFFALTADQAQLGQGVLLITGFYVALNFPFSVFGGVISGFQRYSINNTMTVAVTIVVALTNVAVLLAGYGLLALVAATTTVRVLAYIVYRRNAYRVFPALSIRPSLFRRHRLREVTGFSVYASIIDWANKLNYQIDQLIIGMFLGSAAVAVWAPAERIAWGVQRMTNQLNGVLFPTVVDNHASEQRQKLQQILLEGTRLSLVMVIPVAVALIVLADPLVRAWLGKQAASVEGCIPVLQILAAAVTIRVGNATGTTVLKGAGEHRFLAWVNLATGVVNAGLSILFIKRFGLVGVAFGTLLPVAASSMFILYPAACRRVGVPLRRALIESLLPAFWPAVVVAALLAFTREISSGTLLAVAFQGAIGGVLYLALFFGLAISKTDRAYYRSKVALLTGKRRFATASTVDAGADPAGADTAFAQE